MMQNIETQIIDWRYEGHRIRHAGIEKKLLQAIMEQGIREPLLGTMKDGKFILVDGFKRLRCAKKLMILDVSVDLIAESENEALIILMRRSNSQILTILEQAKLVEELRTIYGMSGSDIAKRLDRSVSWVSVRTGLLTEMRPKVVENIMGGHFPAYVYMYTLRQFMRINKIKPQEIEEFVVATSGHGLSTRDLSTLAYGYFQGSHQIRSEIKNGNLPWCLKSLRPADQASSSSLSELEVKLIRDLDTVIGRMNRLIFTAVDAAASSPEFFAQANLLCSGVIRQNPTFIENIRGLYDRSRPTPQHCGSSK